MRRTLVVAVTALALAACSKDTSEPLITEEFDTFAVDFTSVAYGMTGAHPGAGLHELWRLKNLPEAIKLSAEQEAAITKLLDDFQKAHEADLRDLTKVLDDARKAIEAGKPRSEVSALLREARAIRERMRAATAKLKADIEAELTAEQKAWLASGSPARCYPVVVAPLSAEQRTEIKALYEAFNAATAADRAAVNAALEAARKARQQGKPRAEIQAILEPVREAMARLQAAGDELRADIQAVLTPAQRAAECFGPGSRKTG